MDILQGDLLAGTAIGGITVGFGLVLLASQHSRTSLGVAVANISFGLHIITVPPLTDRVDPDDPALLERLQVLFEAGIVGGFTAYLLALVGTAHGSAGRIRLIRVAVALGFVLTGLLTVLGLLFPAQRLNDFYLSLDEPGALSSPGFWMFASAFLVIGVVFAVAWVSLAQLSLDPGERARAITLALGSVLIIWAPVLPFRLSLAACSGVLLLGLYGQLRYSIAQGERSAFLSRFLSPQVAELVHVDGLAAVMRPAELDVTVVACDLRGFTAYAEAVPSQAVIDLLSDYYDAVGEAVAEVDGTIKDYAGDGILVLIGAPLSREDHAVAGLTLARRLDENIRPVIHRWSTGPHPLGLGIGVASGRVTVGAIGSTARMEYTAVGTPVNLAARLCSAALDGQTLVDGVTKDLAGAEDLHLCATMPIRGLSSDRAVFTTPSQQAEA